jgi:branched-chain amino acid transport system permease protein
MSSPKLRWAGVMALLVAAAVVPLYASPFTNLQLSLILAYGVAILGLDVLIGHAGQVSLGQSAFFGVGAYAAAYAFNHGWGPVAALALAAVLSTLLGLVTAVPAVRLRGFAFGIITLSLPVVGVPLANRLTDLTGGSQGLAVVALPAPGWTGLADDQWHLYVAAAVALVMFVLVRNLLAGRLGRALSAIRLREAMATSMGVRTQAYKILAFVTAALCAGVGGWMYLVAVQFISPDTLQLNLAVSLLVALVVGGLRSPLGCLLGAAFFVVTPNVTDKIDPGRSYLVYGICLLIVLFFFRGGIAGALNAGARRLLERGRPGSPPSGEVVQ